MYRFGRVAKPALRNLPVMRHWPVVAGAGPRRELLALRVRLAFRTARAPGTRVEPSAFSESSLVAALDRLAAWSRSCQRCAPPESTTPSRQHSHLRIAQKRYCLQE